MATRELDEAVEFDFVSSSGDGRMTKLKEVCDERFG
jgi:hypothetical protein